METRLWPEPTDAEKSRFYGRIKNDDDGCHEWQAGKANGYGMFSWRNRPWCAHRLYMVWQNGCVEYPGRVVRHLCHNRSCVAPGHLSWGTAFDNKQDDVKDLRYCFGEKVHTAKLTGATALAIFLEYNKSSVTMLALAKKYSISQSVVSGIVNKKRWIEATRAAAASLALEDPNKLRRRSQMKENLKNASKNAYTKEQVINIWTEYHSSATTQAQLSKKHRVQKSAVSRILRRVIWKHATEGLMEVRKDRSWTPFGKK